MHVMSVFLFLPPDVNDIMQLDWIGFLRLFKIDTIEFKFTSLKSSHPKKVDRSRRRLEFVKDS